MMSGVETSTMTEKEDQSHPLFAVKVQLLGWTQTLTVALAPQGA